MLLFALLLINVYFTQVSTAFVLRLRTTDMHYNCRNTEYPGTYGKVIRFHVPNDKVSWKEPYSEYNPPTYTSPALIGKPWADPEIGADGFHPENEWNNNKGTVNRTNGNYFYEIDKDGYPINPVGRTGLKGRGVLGRWGPNQAGDAIVTRWRTIDGNIKYSQKGKPILEFLSVRRADCGEWALPGGFADGNEPIENTVKRELLEEAISSDFSYLNENEIEPAKKMLDDFLKNGDLIYCGYVDDRRNTDQAWITTTALHFHDEKNEVFGVIKTEAGDDAMEIDWIEIDQYIRLYANHKHFIRDVCKKLNAHFV
ncbi:putative nudix hydrolase 6 isoform X4 [Lycorma delicatula]|uniref:putative nudix hydrolase 6 isoform X4 n=1 Tax=Lycorma delicatula TaxID=130591 RepID=UPI003F5177AC